MISVEYIFKRVNDALSRKNQAGYSSVSDFNGDLRDTENILYEFYYKDYEVNQKISDALAVFIKESDLPIKNGYVSIPTDYRHPLEMAYKYALSKEDCTSTMEEVLMDKLQSNEERDTLASAIRKPSLENKLLYWVQMSDKFRIRPMELIGSATFKYLRQPIFGVYSTVVDTVREMEVYNSATSKDLEWKESEMVGIIDIMLLHKGIEIRDNELVQFAQAKMQINDNK